jgi:5-methylcytosine-specific restriction endonuclease McrA
MAAKRFTEKDIDWFLEDNWRYILRRWRDHFNKGMRPHYLCENCGFISSSRQDFEVDHVLPKAQGGTRNRYQNARTTEKTWDREPQIYPDPALIVVEGQNAEVLCRGCNQGKKDKYFVPDGKGFAYTRIDEDLNPDNRYHGPPKIASGRYC